MPGARCRVGEQAEGRVCSRGERTHDARELAAGFAGIRGPLGLSRVSRLRGGPRRRRRRLRLGGRRGGGRRFGALFGLVPGTQLPLRSEHPPVHHPDRPVLSFAHVCTDFSSPRARSADRYHSRVPEELSRLVALVEQLRRECPWDREQTPETLRTYLLEECYEVLDALDSGDPNALADELGDLLFQILFLSRIAQERGWFSIQDVAAKIAAKMVERHPHVFGDARASDANEVRTGWERRKQRASNAADPLGSLPSSLPALAAAYRMTSRAADLGFDWERDADVAAKIEEELGEWREAERAGDRDAEEKEIGDLLFSIVNLARRRKVDPESALRRAQARFRSRFAKVAKRARESGRSVGDVSPAELDEYWERAKAEE